MLTSCGILLLITALPRLRPLADESCSADSRYRHLHATWRPAVAFTAAIEQNIFHCPDDRTSDHHIPSPLRKACIGGYYCILCALVLVVKTKKLFFLWFFFKYFLGARTSLFLPHLSCGITRFELSNIHDAKIFSWIFQNNRIIQRAHFPHRSVWSFPSWRNLNRERFVCFWIVMNFKPNSIQLHECLLSPFSVIVAFCGVFFFFLPFPGFLRQTETPVGICSRFCVFLLVVSDQGLEVSINSFC